LTGGGGLPAKTPLAHSAEPAGAMNWHFRPGMAIYLPAPLNLSSGINAMDDHPPDRLSNDPGSPFYNAEMLERGVGIRFKGVEKNNVEEYCVSEGWIRVAHATAKDRNGNPMTIKLTGAVEPYFRPSN
jgi:hypothetical protein